MLLFCFSKAHIRAQSKQFYLYLLLFILLRSPDLALKSQIDPTDQNGESIFLNLYQVHEKISLLFPLVLLHSIPRKGEVVHFKVKTLCVLSSVLIFMHHSTSWCRQELAIVRLKQHVANTRNTCFGKYIFFVLVFSFIERSARE